MGLTNGKSGYIVTENFISNFPYGVASGGTSSSITVSSQTYTLLTFTVDGNLTVSTAGIFDYYIIAGGGGGGGYSYGGGGGGGAAGWFTGTSYLAAGTYSCNIGAGGSANSDGSPSFLAGVGLAPAGVRGAYGAVYVYSYGITGPSGSGGGGTAGVNTNNVNTATRGTAYYNGYFGFRGGGGWNGDNNSGGAGGGAGGVGGDSQSASVAGVGGAGKDISSFLGQSPGTTLKMGGGGGGNNGTGGTAGTGGAGAGGASASANSGSGGGGGVNGVGTGSGGSGIIYVRFKV